MTKELGKIESIFFGKDDRGKLGLHITFTFGAKGVQWSEGFWDLSTVNHSENCVWTEKEREDLFLVLIKDISKYLNEAKVDKIDRLKNIPVELTFTGNLLKDWRILTEVI